MHNQQNVSVVIRCYNEEKHIGRLLTGIAQQTTKHVETILVDSGSTDATLAIASLYPVKIVTIKPEEFTFGKSLNLGCRVATGELLVIASAHVYPVYSNWLEKLTAPFDNPNIALTYGKQRGNQKTKYSERQIFAQWFPDESKPNQNTPFCNNANAAIRRSLWEKLQYNETLTGLEDIEWSRKVMELGYQLAYIAEAEIIHVHDETPKRIFNRYRREAIALSQIYPHERFDLSDFIRLFFANAISDYYHAWHDQCLIQNWVSISTFRLMQFWGTYRGFAQHGLVNSQLRQTFYYPRGLSRSSNNSKNNKHGNSIDYAAQQQAFEKIH